MNAPTITRTLEQQFKGITDEQLDRMLDLARRDRERAKHDTPKLLAAADRFVDRIIAEQARRREDATNGQ